MTTRSNPFFELYVGDRVSSREFVTIFSDVLVNHAEALFLPGNVVVTGVQGSGKSMLLSLLKPEIRLEYAQSELNFPVKADLQKFIGAGINLAHSNAIDFGNRDIPGDPNEIPLLFGDFVNYVVALDLMRSVRIFANTSEQLGVTVQFDSHKQAAFVEKVCRDPAWMGYLENCSSVEGIEERMRFRLNSYRRFLHMNVATFDEEIRKTKSAIGMPIAALASSLRKAGIISHDTNVFVHIDQYEELANIREHESVDYRAIINRALARRDPAISYRIGSRGHAWHRHGTIFGTTAKLEEERDYKFIDLDQKLRRNENRKTWIFPGFASDVFARRLRYADLPADGSSENLMRQTFGIGLSASQKALKYGGKHPERAVRVEESWPDFVRLGLIELAKIDPLSARLGEAWILQKGAKNIPADFLDQLPWDSLQRQWWKKERIDVALIHIAGRCQQRPFWDGKDEIVDLSGGNILTFLSLCQFIWEAAMQAKPSGEKPVVREIESEIQALGIFKASDYWLKKIGQETGRSSERLRFVRHLGNLLSRNLLSDRKLSNPGHNGFSVQNEELDAYPEIRSFLEELADYGNLLSLPHTTKEKDRRARTKWYLNPVLCPQFKIPHKRLKEPKYVGIADVADWMGDVGINVSRPPVPRQRTKADDLPLFKL